VNLPGIQLEDTDLRRIKLGYSNLTRANLQNCILKGADLGSCNLREVNFSGAELSEYLDSFEEDRFGNPSGSTWRYTSLDSADLTDAKAFFADLSGANLRGSVLVNTKLHDTDLENIDKDETDFRVAKGFKRTSIRERMFTGGSTHVYP